jgi:PhoPQ-activated pathogenicity-related protein
LNGKNSDLFQIIDYKLVQDLSQNWANSKLVKISQNYHNIDILSNLVKISHHMIVELSVPFL